MEMKMVRNLTLKLDLITGDDAPSKAVLEAYHMMLELPMKDDMIEPIVDLYRWSLAAVIGCSPPLAAMSGGRLIEDLDVVLWVLKMFIVLTKDDGV
jgi:hypothetical protein